ncbi:hypothetical protein I6E85_00725 [Pseudoalteromonas sp. NZS71]|jgi:hypothetical protein|uniref:hypothetical protein n=1 Tax=Pseudoalteromonas sp. NZS71 TaxID=2792052 RepID=UPI0018CF4B86|nr:hypothetical protein [Pseudoalteromonas sp. NZS71]MBH0059671.1 hypothetical protein [Pseudoalteromonas sp. NZS71]
MEVAMFQRYKEWSKKYDVMALELKKRGYHLLKMFFFLSYFTLGFAHFKTIFYKEYDSDKIIRVLFDESLFFFSILTFTFFAFLFVLSSWLTRKSKLFNPLKVFFHWASNSSFDFSFGLMVVYLAGFTIKAKVSIESIPWFNFSDLSTYVLFVLTVFFYIITVDLLIFVTKDIPKKKQVVKLLGVITALLAGLTVISNIMS